MARTKSSRGVAPFKMRSGNSPLPLFGKFGQRIKRGFNALTGLGGDDKVQEIPGTIVTDEQKTALDGSQDILGEKGEGNKLEAIAEIIASDKSGIGNPNTMLTKKYKYKK